MKNVLKYSLIYALLLGLPQLHSALQAQDFQSAFIAIQKSDVNSLEQLFDDELEVSVGNDVDYYTRAEAAIVVRNFFRQSKPSSIEPMHSGGSKGHDANYGIAKLVTSSGNFRVYIYGVKEGNVIRIQELRFDPI